MKSLLIIILFLFLIGCTFSQQTINQEVNQMKALFIVAQEGYQPLEYATLKKILEKAGVEVVTASKKVGVCKDKMGGSTQATIAIGDVNVANYDAVVFIGGPGATVYQQDSKAHQIAQEAVKQDKILAAICLAPTILAYAGVLEGKKATVWDSGGQQKAILEKNSATYTGQAVTVDGKIVTANGPGAAEEFGKKILGLLK